MLHSRSHVHYGTDQEVPPCASGGNIEDHPAVGVGWALSEVASRARPGMQGLNGWRLLQAVACATNSKEVYWYSVKAEGSHYYDNHLPAADDAIRYRGSVKAAEEVNDFLP